ncbi:hypothetical protein [Halalkalibacter alkalisediminis]|uniref:Uncharacterized protein n=1 Tax=Halalkalibacter alkalisediminis TaxID=935616 RepID=A0ABV6NNY4_9BACI|nr:hypothetical protein [Halalkalibacter alkalisediminis]
MVNELGKKNKLIKDQLKINGEKVHLSNIQANVLVLATSEDQVVPETLIKPIMPALSIDDKTYERIKGGHVSVAMTGKVPSVLTEWLNERSDYYSQ